MAQASDRTGRAPVGHREDLEAAFARHEDPLGIAVEVRPAGQAFLAGQVDVDLLQRPGVDAGHVLDEKTQIRGVAVEVDMK